MNPYLIPSDSVSGAMEPLCTLSLEKRMLKGPGSPQGKKKIDV